MSTVIETNDPIFDIIKATQDASKRKQLAKAAKVKHNAEKAICRLTQVVDGIDRQIEAIADRSPEEERQARLRAAKRRHWKIARRELTGTEWRVFEYLLSRYVREDEPVGGVCVLETQIAKVVKRSARQVRRAIQNLTNLPNASIETHRGSRGKAHGSKPNHFTFPAWPRPWQF